MLQSIQISQGVLLHAATRPDGHSASLIWEGTVELGVDFQAAALQTPRAELEESASHPSSPFSVCGRTNFYRVLILLLFGLVYGLSLPR